jgi:hypothetical protein
MREREKSDDNSQTKSDALVVVLRVLRVLRVLCACNFFWCKDFFADRSTDMGCQVYKYGA